MDKRIEQALAEAGARLLRHRKHLVYELANGRRVVMSSTPSDRREVQNALRDIRKAVGTQTAKEKQMTETIVSQPPQPPTLLSGATDVQETSKLGELTIRRTERYMPPSKWRAKLDAAIKTERDRAALLMQQAEHCENRARMLEALLPYADEPDAEQALRGLFPAPPINPPQSPASSTAPKRGSATGFMTADNVQEVCCRLGSDFTSVDVAEQICGHAPSQKERHMAIDAMHRLRKKGLLRPIGKKRGKALLWEYCAPGKASAS